MRATEDIIWTPDPVQAAASNLRRFMDKHGISTYDELLRRSVTEPEWFWDAVVRSLGIEWFTPYERVLDTSRGVEWARWFVGGELNVAHNCADKHAWGGRADRPAVIYEGEDSTTRILTYGELATAANHLAHGLRHLGIGRGDRVGIFLPMIPETVVALLAVAKVGAVFTPIFSGFSAPAIAARLADCEVKVLITADGFRRRGAVVRMKAIADQAVSAVPTVQHVLVVRHLGIEMPWQEGRDMSWTELTAGQPGQYPTARMGSEDPCMIIYTSGTTGRPKGVVHVHAGFPLKSAQDMAHCFDLQAGERIFWLTDIGWMMGPWLIFGGLMLGATIVLYDGAPDYPGPDRLWRLVERHAITHLGLAPTLIRSLMVHGEEPVRRHDLSSLRVLGSTGEPWNLDPYMWYFRVVGGGRCPIINYSGGTEISGGIVGCTVLQPLKPMAFTGPIPGMAADVVDDAGRSVRGGVGELVLRSPWPGMARGFWRDPARYLETYWSRWPGVWHHGDWASVDDDGFWYIHGRSDDTIKVAGKRVGPAEVESILVGHPAVAEAAAIGVPHEVKGEVVVAFVVLQPGAVPSEELRKALQERVVAGLGKALRPEAVKFVTALPKTRNAKVMRRVIRARYLGQPLGDLSSLENPEAVEEIDRAR